MTLVSWSYLLILLAVVDWIATVVLLRASRRVREPALDERVVASTILSFAATCIAILAVAFILEFDLPDGSGTAILVAAVLLMSLPQLVWFVAYRLGRFR